ncbi:MAG: CopG family transcriptional regulator [Thermoguttaceae bacterium]|nr:CopG family transcriptional regulator [Thermoguttaceae bacterium]MBR0191244.1 CopG family transcriptional regulator [Thermoguttaceae bacterium]
MQPTENKYVRTSTSIPWDHYRQLEKLAERYKVSIAWIIRDAIEKYLEKGTSLDIWGEMTEKKNESN